MTDLPASRADAYDGCVSSPEVWNQFDHDPRNAANSALRASDHDRGVIESVLADAYAEGRLDRTEYDERSDTAMTSRTLGDLMPLVSDLPVSSAPRTTFADAAVRAYKRERHQAIWALLSISLLCWTIWAATMLGGLAWPLFAMIGPGLNLGRVLFNRQELIDKAAKQLEKKERVAIEKPDKSGN